MYLLYCFGVDIVCTLIVTSEAAVKS